MCGQTNYRNSKTALCRNVKGQPVLCLSVAGLPTDIRRKVHTAIIAWFVIGWMSGTIVSFWLPMWVGGLVVMASVVACYFWIKKRVLPRIGLPQDSYVPSLREKLKALGKTYRYYCAGCGFNHDLKACPKCGSNIKKLRF